jgi:predicted CDP-diglyceride synthetase/phosphatidate cytidylyltransferase
MSAAEVLRQLRRFLLMLSVALFSGALIELWLVGHTEDWIQWLPFALSIAGVAIVLWMMFRPDKRSVKALRLCMILVALGSLFGIYQHVTGNIAFERELQPNASAAQLISRGLQGGNPLLAPGILGIAALLALSATYRYEITTDATPD